VIGEHLAAGGRHELKGDARGHHRAVKLEPEREVTGSSDPAPQPRVGDKATVVADVGDGLYLLESCTDDGMTLWLGEFAAEELALVERPEGRA